MILTVMHKTLYRYDVPVRGIVQSFRMTPSVFDGQSVRDWNIEVTDGIAGGTFRDGAGDRVISYSVRGPVSELAVTVSGTVETWDLAGVLRGHREVVAPEAYLRDTLPTRLDSALTELGATAVKGETGDTLARAHALSRAVSGAIAYRSGSTGAHTTASEALAQGEGVCQDMAHALIAIARGQGIPARYVSGYLLTDGAGQEHDAAHAWAELHVPGLGWVGFDPANECCPDARYIRLGSGFDAADAAPIRGISRGTGEENLSVTVAVQSVQQ